jgi:hypothetical protein
VSKPEESEMTREQVLEQMKAKLLTSYDGRVSNRDHLMMCARAEVKPFKWIKSLEQVLGRPLVGITAGGKPAIGKRAVIWADPTNPFNTDITNEWIAWADRIEEGLLRRREVIERELERRRRAR